MSSGSLKGVSFKTSTGVKFRVVKDRFFPRGKHDKANGAYLDSLREGFLVSVFYQAVPVAMIILESGVAKLEIVEVDGERIKGAGKISACLGVSKTRKPILLT